MQMYNTTQQCYVFNSISISTVNSLTNIIEIIVWWQNWTTYTYMTFHCKQIQSLKEFFFWCLQNWKCLYLTAKQVWSGRCTLTGMCCVIFHSMVTFNLRWGMVPIFKTTVVKLIRYQRIWVYPYSESINPFFTVFAKSAENQNILWNCASMASSLLASSSLLLHV